MQPPASPPTRNRAPSRRAVALVGVGVILASLLLGAVVRLNSGVPASSPIAVASSPLAPPSLVASATAVASLTPTPTAAPPDPTTSPSSTPAPASATSLPLKLSAYEVGAEIQMAPGPNGGLYVSIPRFNAPVLVLLGRDGKPTPGWPIAMSGVESCTAPLPDTDGSVRLLCTVFPVGDNLDSVTVRAFGFDATGRPLDGWPVDTDPVLASRMIGDTLWLIVEPYTGEGTPAAPAYLLQVHADGTLDQGVSTKMDRGSESWAIGPDGIGYQSGHYDWSPTDLADVTSEVTAFDLTGRRAGWPVTIKGNASELAFDASGLVYLVVGSPDAAPTRTMVLDKGGHVLKNGSGALSITSSNRWDGAGAESPGVPVVSGDGWVYIMDTHASGAAILAVTPGGKPMTGWPYKSSTDLGWAGHCGSGDTGCGHLRTMPTIGKDGILYVIHAPASRSTGGSVVAIDANTHVVSGWPVGLKRAGSMFWSMAVNPDGGVWALAVEPESHGASATILSLAADSTVRWSATIVQP